MKNDQLITFLKMLEERTSLFIPNANYRSIVAMIEGYSIGVSHSGQKSPLDNFQDWVKDKVGHHFSYHWSAYILIEMEKNNEEKAKAKLFQLLNEYLSKSQILDQPETN